MPDGKLIPGTRGISLFIVPKKMVNAQGAADRRAQRRGAGRAEPQAGLARHDQHAAELWRGQVPGAMAKPDAVGYLGGRSRARACACMFHMMNEARIGVGMAATMLGMAGYYASLDYAKNRPQGRPIGPGRQGRRRSRRSASSNTPTSSACCCAQKAYCEGALALELYCARLVDEQHTGTARDADEARLLLEVLDAHCQKLAQRVVPGGQLAWPSRCTAATATRAISRWSSTGATTA